MARIKTWSKEYALTKWAGWTNTSDEGDRGVVEEGADNYDCCEGFWQWQCKLYANSSFKWAFFHNPAASTALTMATKKGTHIFEPWSRIWSPPANWWDCGPLKWFTLKLPDRMPSRNQTRRRSPIKEIPHSQQKPPWPWSDFPATFDYQRITNHIPIIIPIVDG